VTRGKRLVVLVGQRKALAIAVKGARARRRWSKLREWLAAAFPLTCWFSSIQLALGRLAGAYVHRFLYTMTKVGKSDREETFAGTHVNDEDAPEAVIYPTVRPT